MTRYWTMAVFSPCLFCLMANAPAGEASTETIRALEKRAKSFETITDNLGVRSLFEFALQAADAGWRPDLVERVLELAEKMQDRDPKSKTYGNFRWYWRNEKPGDQNAVEFSMQQAVLLWMFYKDKLTPAARKRLEGLMKLGVEGMRRHGVAVSYTNIFLMKTSNAILMGEAMNMPKLAEEGYQMFDQWLMWTWEAGISEYLSPTYYATDLDDLGPIARYAKREEGRRAAEAVLRFYWTDIAANYYLPGERLGGAHSRDYDYLTGHGGLDDFVRDQGWIAGKPRTDVFHRLVSWKAPENLRADILARTPRLIQKRWGTAEGRVATQYAGKQFSIGSSGESYSDATDKTLTVNLPGGPKMPVVNFFMDARGDPYGKIKFSTGSSGHNKALHLLPFLTSVQRGPEALLLASIDTDSPSYKRYAPTANTLLSHLVIPAKVELWLGDKPLQAPGEGARVPIPDGAPVFLRLKDVAVGVRFVLGLDTAGKAALVELVNDGVKYEAMRLTCVHAAANPKGRGTVAVWVRCAEGLDDKGFAHFRSQFINAKATAEVKGAQVEVAVPGLLGPMRLVADLAAERRLVREGAEPGTGEYLLAVDGRDLGREILKDLGPVKKCQDLLAAEKSGEGTNKPDTVFEAEDAALIVPPFEIGADTKASGGKFVWMPGEPGQPGGNPFARANWLLHIPKSGAYYVWGRVMAPTPSDDSFHVSVRQGGKTIVPPMTDWQTGTHTTWECTPAVLGRPSKDAKPTPIQLSEGSAILEISCREDGTKLDALFFTADPGAKPEKTKGNR